MFKNNYLNYIIKCMGMVLLFSLHVSVVWPQYYQYPYSTFKERDPLKPLIDEGGNILIRERKEIGSFLLQGIIYSPEGGQAILNNEVYKEGDTVEGYKIKKIEAYKVILEKNGEEFILKWEGK